MQKWYVHVCIVPFFLCFCTRGKYYKMAGEAELAAFLSQPERFVAPEAPRPLPSSDLLPKRCSQISIKTMFPKKFEIQGFCPVTYIDDGRKCVHIYCYNDVIALTPCTCTTIYLCIFFTDMKVWCQEIHLLLQSIKTSCFVLHMKSNWNDLCG